MTKNINILRNAFGRCIDGYAKQVGLRALRDARLFATSNPEYAAERLEKAQMMLRYAQELTKRAA